MKKLYILLTFCLSSLLVHQASIAQDFAYEPPPLHQDHEVDRKALKSVLVSLEKKFGIYFTFESQVILDKYVQSEVVITEDLDQTLMNVLYPLNLKFKKLSDKYYTIYPHEEPNQKETGAKKGHGLQSLGVGGIQSSYQIPATVTLPVFQFTTSGTVTDENSQTLPGASVVEKGTINGTTTDASGNYTLNVQDENSVLVFSFIGYISQEVAVNGRSVIDVTMLEDVKSLDEVVVVGYGTKKKVNLTGAVDVIDSKQLENRQSATISQLLQGLSPGLSFSLGNDGFQPGAQMNINIRGIGSINGGSPFVIIDGFPGDLDKVNPEDIESISVLKDAAASAIYGARAPYGVIMVTTKSGKKNTKFTATYSGNLMFGTPSNLPEMVDSYTYARVMNEAGDNGGGRPYTNEEIDRIIAFQQGDVEFIKSLMPAEIRDQVSHFETIPNPDNPNTWLTSTNAHANYDWFDEWYGNSVNQKHNLSFQGGSDNTAYYFSAGYLGQEGVLNYGDDTFDRINVLAKIKTAITNWWDIRYEPRLIRSNRVRPQNQDGDYSIVFHQIPRTYPTNPKYDGFGNYDIQSKIPWTEFAGMRDTKQTTNWQTFGTEFRPVMGWKINADFAYRSVSEFTSSPRLTVYDHLVDGTEVATSNTVPSSITQYHTDAHYWTSNIYSSFEANVKNHNFLIMGGVQFESSEGRYLNAQRTNLLQPNVPSLETASGAPSVSESLTHWTTQGIFSRLAYNYKEKYLLEANVRYDGSSVFKPGNQWGFFPSFSMGWNVDKEAFWEPVERYVSTLKIRGSWGKLGNQRLDPYSDISLIPLQSSPLNWIFNYGSARPIGYTTTPSLVSPDLKWETSATKNLGVDISFLEEKLQAEFNWFERITTDMVGPSEAKPGVLGASVPKSNNATLQTRGWELALSWRQHIGNELTYFVRGNVYDSKSVITKYYNPTNILSTWYVGKENGEIWGYTANGLYQTQEELDVYRSQVDLSQISNSWNPGDLKYQDTNGDGEVSSGSNTLDDHGDLSIIGNSTPRYQYGLSVGLNYKGLDFSILVKGVGKREEFYDWNWFNYWGIRRTVHAVVTPEHLDYFRDQPGDPTVGLHEGDANLNTDAFWPKPYTVDGQNRKNREPSDRYLADLSFLRVQNMQLGYTLPDKIASKIKMKKLRVYLSGENLFTHHNLPVRGIDPIADKGSLGAGSTYEADIITSLGITLTY